MESTTRTVTGVCNLCEAICGLTLTLTDGPDGPAVTGVRGNQDDPLSRGHVCPKGVAIADVAADPERLTRPVRRIGEGDEARWEEIRWDEALDLVADGLRGVQERHGRDSVAVYLGNPNVHSLGAMTHGSALVKALRTRNRFSATSVDQLPHQLVAHWMFGHQLLLPVPDLDRTLLFVVLGGNPMVSNGSMMTVPDFPGRLRELQARGGRMVVLDPRRTDTAKAADEHHLIRPGTDAYVLLAMVHEVLAAGARVPDHVRGLEDVRRVVEPFTPERAEAHSGVPADVVRRLAEELRTTPRAVVYSRIGVSAGPWGTVGVWAVNVLNVVTGHLDAIGGSMFTSPAIDVVGTGLVGRGSRGRWSSRVRGLPESLGELPVSVLREEITEPGEGQVRGLLTVAGNPVLSTPDGAGLGTALESLEFMAAIDIYVNETTRHADVILPPTTALERDHYDLIFHVLAVRNTARFTPAVLPKASHQRHDWEISRDLVARLVRGAPLRTRLVTRARTMLSPTRLVGVLLRRGRSGATLAQLRRQPEGVDLGPLRDGQLPTRLQTRDRLLDLAPAEVLADVARLDADDSPRADLVLIGRRGRRDCNSWMHNSERLTKGRSRHHLWMHPQDLSARGLTDGAEVTVTSRVGSVRVEVAATEDVMPGVVSLPHGFGHADNPGMSRASAYAGVSPNDLTDPLLLDVSGNAALNGVPVTVEP